jgi:CheY-like chemotaxis protein
VTNLPATILIVDDDVQNRKLLDLLLRPEGYNIRSAGCGEEALASVAEHHPDLVLLDVLMPGLDGYEVTDILKRDSGTADIPILLITAHDDHRGYRAGIAAGADEILTKPVDRAQLWLHVRNLLGMGRSGERAPGGPPCPPQHLPPR